MIVCVCGGGGGGGGGGGEGGAVRGKVCTVCKFMHFHLYQCLHLKLSSEKHRKIDF